MYNVANRRQRNNETAVFLGQNLYVLTFVSDESDCMEGKWTPNATDFGVL